MLKRLRRELDRILINPSPGISCFPRDDTLKHMDASVMGVEDTPYEFGVFKIDILITDRYPFYPPRVRFLTRVYHPNVDNNGRICLDLLKSPPSGQWRPTYSIEAILVAIQMLLTYPNPDDPLMEDIAKEYRLNRKEFERKAKAYTQKYACQHSRKDKQGTSKSEAKETTETTPGKRKRSEGTETVDVPSKHPKRGDVPSKHSKNDDVPSKHSKNDDVPSKHSKSDDVPSKHSKNDDVPSKHSKSDDVPSKHSKNDDVTSKHSKNDDVASKHSKNDDVPSKHSKDDDVPSNHSKNDDGPSKHSKDDDVPSDHSKNDDGPSNQSKNDDGPATHSKNDV